jgi:hypothetical protein
VHPRLDPIRSDPRSRTMPRRMGLDQGAPRGREAGPGRACAACHAVRPAGVRRIPGPPPPAPTAASRCCVCRTRGRSSGWPWHG